MFCQTLALVVVNLAVVLARPSEVSDATAPSIEDFGNPSSTLSTSHGSNGRQCLRVVIFLAAIVSAFKALRVRRLVDMLAPGLRQKSADDLPRVDLMGAWEEMKPFVCNDLAACLGALTLLFGVVECMRMSLESHHAEVGIQHWCHSAAACLELVGLAFLRHMIRRNKSVAGISRTSVVLYALIYMRRLTVLPPLLPWYLYSWRTKVMSLAAVVIIVDVLRCMFGPYRATYQKESERVRPWHIVLPAFALALVYAPSRTNGDLMTYSFTACLIMDCFALLPQVVLMAWESCPVQAPIAHFVLATAFSRSIDMYYWTVEYAAAEDFSAFRGSATFVVSLHFLGLLMIVDFFYYYVKARMMGSSFHDETPVCEV